MKVKQLAIDYKEKYPLTFNRKDPEIDQLLLERFNSAWEVARISANILKENYGAHKVMIFGSLTDYTSFTQWSDIDLAVWGIPDQKFYAAVGAITSLSTEFKIDLIDALECRPSILHAIKTEGTEV